MVSPAGATGPEVTSQEIGIDDFSDAHRPLYEVKANLFKGVSHPVRVRVLEVLSAAPDDVSVADLIADTGLEASHLSQHLSVLRRHNLVVAERRASQVFYRLAFPEVADLMSVSRALLIKILERTHDQLVSTVSSAEAPTQSLTQMPMPR
ncbi:ArsR/SmtB family transcription factor [Sanguibacter gelidistatuariae]|nr:metalloregulator ArsR/SmtB family transcription factor [Sanguibacter gelidistatuariae]